MIAIYYSFADRTPRLDDNECDMDSYYLSFIYGHLPYWFYNSNAFRIIHCSFSRNLIKKIVGLNIFQTSVFMFYISIGKISGGTLPYYLTKRLLNQMYCILTLCPMFLFLQQLLLV